MTAFQQEKHGNAVLQQIRGTTKMSRQEHRIGRHQEIA